MAEKELIDSFSNGAMSCIVPQGLHLLERTAASFPQASDSRQGETIADKHVLKVLEALQCAHMAVLLSKIAPTGLSAVASNNAKDLLQVLNDLYEVTCA